MLDEVRSNGSLRRVVAPGRVEEAGVDTPRQAEFSAKLSLLLDEYAGAFAISEDFTLPSVSDYVLVVCTEDLGRPETGSYSINCPPQIPKHRVNGLLMVAMQVLQAAP